MGIAVGLGVALAMVGIGVSIVAIPLFLLAQVIEPGSRIDHPFLREGLLGWAVPVGLVLGLVTGVAVGVWYGRGGRLPPNDDRPTYLP